MSPPRPMTRLSVKCANPGCKRFICTVKVYADIIGIIAEIVDIKCRKCKHVTCFKINGVSDEKSKLQNNGSKDEKK